MTELQVHDSKFWVISVVVVGALIGQIDMLAINTSTTAGFADVIDCPVVTLNGSTVPCYCSPQNVTVDSTTGAHAPFDYLTCGFWSEEILDPDNVDRFVFPPSTTVYVDCLRSDSLNYTDLIEGVAACCGEIVEEVSTLGDTRCFHPFTISSDTYSGLPNLRKLRFWEENPITIERDAFTPLTRLDELLLIDIKLSTLPPGTFDGLIQLRFLILSDNMLCDLPDGIFKDLRGLQLLGLQGNRLSRVSGTVFQPLEYLTELYLHDNNISYVDPDAFRSMRSLDILDLSWNVITQLNISFFGKSKLVLAHNLLSSYSESMFTGLNKYTNFVDLSNNWIASISAKSLKTDEYDALTSVDLSYNRLRALPLNLLSWGRKLSLIDLRNNSLRSLPAGLFDIESNPVNESRLERGPLTISLSGNPFVCDCNLIWFRLYDGPLVWISDLEVIECSSPPKLQGVPLFAVEPDDFRCAEPSCPQRCSCHQSSTDLTTGLQLHVDCTSEDLATIPRDIPSNTFTINLSGNSLNELKRYVMVNSLPVLSELTLSQCNISAIEKGAFQDFHSVQVLRLDGNNLVELDISTFSGLSRLRTLYLNRSSLKHIETGIFEDVQLLQYLFLHDNILVHLPPIQFMPLGIRSITLYGNPLICDCDVVSYQSWLRNHSDALGLSPQVQDTKCSDGADGAVSIREVHLAPYCGIAVIGNPSRTALSSIGSILCVIILTFVCIIFYKRNEACVKLFLLSHFPPAMSEEDANKAFDVFISYSQHDDDFVLNHLVPFLEDDKHSSSSFSVCLHFRHFIPGDTIANNIVQAVGQSRRVVLVLSENFLKSSWCMYEFRMAHLQALQDRENTLLLITLGKIPEELLDPELKAHMKVTTYLESCDSNFKSKLLLALRRSIPKRQKGEVLPSIGLL